MVLHKDNPKNAPVKEHHCVFLDCFAFTCFDLLVGFVVFATSLLLYGSTVFPVITGGDSGELIATSCELGVAHPPGYPLFTLLTALAMKVVPFGSLGYRANLFAAFLSALSNFFLYFAILGYLSARERKYVNLDAVTAALGGSLTFGLSPLTWQYATQAEVFSLNNFLISVYFFLGVWYWRTKSPRALLWGAFWSGLVLTNQHTSVCFVLPMALAIVIDLLWSRRLSLHRVHQMTIASAVGFSPYLYLIWASLWGGRGWGDIGSISGFLTHLLRREYGTFSLGSKSYFDDHNAWDRMEAFADSFVQEFGVCGAALAVVGVCVMLSPTGPHPVQGPKQGGCGSLGVVWISMYLFYVGLFQSLANLSVQDPLLLGVQKRFWLQSNLLASFWVGVGVYTTSRIMRSMCCVGQGTSCSQNVDKCDMSASRRSNSRPTMSSTAYTFCPDHDRERDVAGLPPASHDTYSVTCFFLVVVLMCTRGCLGLLEHDMSRSTFVVDAARAALDSVPENAMIVAESDMFLYPMRYLQSCEEVRPDVRLVEFSLMKHDWYAVRMPRFLPNVTFPGERMFSESKYGDIPPPFFSFRHFVEANLDSFRIFILPNSPDVEKEISNFQTWPRGAVAELRSKEAKMKKSVVKMLMEEGVSSLSSIPTLCPGLDPYTPEHWETQTDIFLQMHLSKGASFAGQLSVRGGNGAADLFAKYYREALAILARRARNDIPSPELELYGTQAHFEHMLAKSFLDANKINAQHNTDPDRSVLDLMNGNGETLEWDEEKRETFVAVLEAVVRAGRQCQSRMLKWQ
eukprot:Rmarinus@m.3042